MTPEDPARPAEDPGDQPADAPVPFDDAAEDGDAAAEAADEHADEPAADGPGAAGPVPPGGSRRRAGRAATLLSLLCLGLAACSVGLALALQEQRQEQRARTAALAAARQAAVNLTSIDHRQLDRDLQRVLDGATGAFEQDFAARADDLRQLLRENQVVSEGSVLEAGLVRASERRATALVVVDSTVRNTAEADGSTRNYRVQVDLVRSGSRWLVSSLQFVG